LTDIDALDHTLDARSSIESINRRQIMWYQPSPPCSTLYSDAARRASSSDYGSVPRRRLRQHQRPSLDEARPSEQRLFRIMEPSRPDALIYMQFDASPYRLARVRSKPVH